MKTFYFLFIFLCFVSCNEIQEKTSHIAKETGKTVSKTGSEFVNGVSDGFDKAYECSLFISERVKNLGLSSGKFFVQRSENGVKNKLSIYFIFSKNFNDKITIKLCDSRELEYGRITKSIVALKDSAGFFDFIFDKRTYIEAKSIIRIE